MVVVVDLSAPADEVILRVLNGAEEAITLLEAARARSPAFLEFRGCGHKLLIGVSESCGCAQFSPLSGEPPYQMAISGERSLECASETIEYSMNGCPTEIPSPFNIPIALVAEIAKHFVQTEDRWSLVEWEEV